MFPGACSELEYAVRSSVASETGLPLMRGHLRALGLDTSLPLRLADACLVPCVDRASPLGREGPLGCHQSHTHRLP